jgi:hypothetical protein
MQLTKRELAERVEVYEGVLHDIQLLSSVAYNPVLLGRLIETVNKWSYAHRVGNGQLSDQEQAAIVNVQFLKLKNAVWHDQPTEDKNAT